MSIHQISAEIADAIEFAANETKLQPSAIKVEVTRTHNVILITQRMGNGQVHKHTVTVQRIKE